MFSLHTKQKRYARPPPCVMAYDITPLVPLSLDRVIDNEPITSSLPIFQLPIELINHVIPYLSRADIQNLTLVDRDANQLARALMFAHVKLDYSSPALELLAKLIKESDPSCVPTRRIGVCVRRLTISTNRRSLNTREGTALEDLQALMLGERFVRIKAAKQAETHYLQSICDLLPYLPNLHILDWDDDGPLNLNMIESFRSSSIAHLRLNGPILDTQFTISPSEHRDNWPLESLYINVGWSSTTPTPGDTSQFLSSLLRLTAPTLRHLVWSGHADALAQPCQALEQEIRFPALHDVVLDRVLLKNSSLLDGILGKRALIRSLSIEASPVMSQFLAKRGRISSLKSLRWTLSTSASYDDMTEFIHSNSQLACLDVACPLPPPVMESILTRHTQPHFDHLLALHLVSDTSEFSEGTLRIIASMKSLEHLWLSAGVQYGWRYEWEVNHEHMMEILEPLTRLESLVFTRDAYRVDGHVLLDTSVNRYYINKVLPQDLSLNQYLTEDEMKSSANLQGTTFDNAMRIRESFRVLTWERWHQSQMVMFATDYSTVFRGLKWCFMGQLPMRIEETPFWRIAEMDTPERDPCLESLRAYWGRVIRAL